MKQKLVFNASQVIHMFCNNVKGDFKSPTKKYRGRQVFIEGDTIYSYGHHYPMAKRHNDCMVILINSEKSSHTTNGHRCEIKHSIPKDVMSFYVPNIHAIDSWENKQYLINELSNSISEFLSARVQVSTWIINDNLINLNKYLNLLNEKNIVIDDLMGVLNQISKDREEKNKIRYIKKQKRLEENRLKEIEEMKLEVDAWYKNENKINVPAWAFNLDYSPIRIKGEIVQSNRGAEVPLNEAFKAAMLLNNGQGNLLIGQKIGHFKVEKIEDDKLIIGCHTLSIKQCLNVLLNRGE